MLELRKPLTCEALVGAHLLRAGGILVKAVVVVCELWELAVVAAALVEEGNDENSLAYPLSTALRAYLRGRRLPGSQGPGHGNAGQLHFK